MAIATPRAHRPIPLPAKHGSAIWANAAPHRLRRGPCAAPPTAASRLSFATASRNRARQAFPRSRERPAAQPPLNASSRTPAIWSVIAWTTHRSTTAHPVPVGSARAAPATHAALQVTRATTTTSAAAVSAIAPPTPAPRVPSPAPRAPPTTTAATPSAKGRDQAGCASPSAGHRASDARTISSVAVVTALDLPQAACATAAAPPDPRAPAARSVALASASIRTRDSPALRATPRAARAAAMDSAAAAIAGTDAASSAAATGSCAPTTSSAAIKTA